MLFDLVSIGRNHNTGVYITLDAQVGTIRRPNPSYRGTVYDCVRHIVPGNKTMSEQR